MTSESRVLSDQVIRNGYWIGYGACALVAESPFQNKMDKFGSLSVRGFMMAIRLAKRVIGKQFQHPIKQ